MACSLELLGGNGGFTQQEEQVLLDLGITFLVPMAVGVG
jgi:hypothetical protein